MRNKRGKLLGFMLTLALVIGLLPVMSLTAFADGFPQITVDPANSGTVTQAPWDRNHYRVTATPAEGYIFQKWTYLNNGVANLESTNQTDLFDTTLVSNLVAHFVQIVNVTSVTLDSAAITLTVGGTKKLTATVNPDNATYKNVTWTTDDATVATVANGVVTAVGKGTATITATATNGTNDTADDFTATCTVTVHAHSFTYSVDGATITATCSSEGCPLTDNKATLTITAPTAGGGAAVLSGDVSAFGVSGADIKYAVKNGSTWGEETSTAPSGNGFFKAIITVSNDITASVTYGVSAISVASGIEHGSITAPSVATVSAEVTLTITPETGYELNTITVTKSNNTTITVTTNSDGSRAFVMPDEEVTVSGTFKLRDYTISFEITSGSITVPETAKMNETVIIIISPDEGYGVYSFDIPGVDNLELVSKDTDTGVEIYTFTMPYQDITVNVELRETTIYTIFYKADSTVTSILYRFSSGNAGFTMKSDTKIDDTACWGGQMRGAKDRTSFPISFNVNSSNWGAFQDCNVVTDLSSSFSSLAQGNAILVEGDDNAFVASFMWGFYDTDESGNLVSRDDYGTKYYFVTANTTSISVPNPTRRGYNFAGWSYTDKDDEDKTIDADSVNTTVNIKDNIDKTTIFGAIWRRAVSTITYDLNGGSWSNSNTASVTYGEKLPQPTAPTKDAYAFNGWIVKSKARAIKGTQGVTLTAGSNFDFDATKITENITLQATWKHVHSYVNVPLSKVNDLLPGAMPQEYITNYGQYVHFSICSLADEFHFEGHTFDKNGKCACGAERPVEEVTLQETYGDLKMVIQSKPKKDSEVILNAPVMDTKQFVKWEYRSLNGSTWHDLVSTPVVGFIIPDSLRVHAVYESLTEPKLTLKAERYSTDGLLFTMQYALPQGWKATNAAVVYGDNHMLRYMKVVRSNTSWYSITEPFFGIEIVSAGTFDSATYYYDREDNILAKNKNKNKAALRNKILNGEAVNIPGYHEASYKKAQSLGQTSGYAYGGLTGVKDENNGNHYFYVLGFVEYTDASGSAHMAAVGPIAVTYNLTSNEVTDNNVFTYNY